MLGSNSSVTKDEIEKRVDQVLLIPDYNHINREQLVREIESIYNVRMEEYRIIEREERRRPWLNVRKTEISWSFWIRYRTYLQDEKNYAPETINKLDRLTDKILDSLFNPVLDIEIDKKGLVVGQVQSGKTSNYTGLICKAVDSGFKLIIVLAGIHNNLRSQTQLRLDEGFLGFDTQHTRAFNQNNFRIGVGILDRAAVAHSLTSSLNNGDFTQGAANSSGFNFDTNEPIIAVVKKNASVLRRLLQWLSAKSVVEADGHRKIRNKSLLIIDDEADNASINISNDPEQRSGINKLINDILGLFGKRGYVGYTATPFANIFIPLDENDLFPRDFIINIPPPSNYIGPERVFGFSFPESGETPDNVLPIVNRIDDYPSFAPDGHKKNQYNDWKRPEDVPEQVIKQFFDNIPVSLKIAVRCFVLTCAIRRLRGQNKCHNSMLIHITRFQNWQSIITAAIQQLFDYYRLGINQNDTEILDEFKATYEQDSYEYESYVTISNKILNSSLADIDTNISIHSWADILPLLDDAVARIEIRAIHGGSGEVLDYYDHKDGLSVIAVGGNKLSRGLTLEGLSVSYYLRSSRMYDTLMQMGRWFGYRPGYIDLCRLFTSQELNEWFCHITHASEELREEFDYMSDIAGSTPEQYALKVRTHPGVLQISATNKLRTAVDIEVTWAGRLVESYEFIKKTEIIENNLAALHGFVSTLPNPPCIKNNNFLWENVNADNVVSFLSEIRTPENLKAYAPQNLIRFINNQITNDELTSWRICLMSKANADLSIELTINGNCNKIGTFLRRYDDKNSNESTYYLRKSHIISPKDEFIDLTGEEYEKAMNLTIERRKKQNKDGEPTYPNGEIVRNEIRSPKNPLLLIYLLDPTGANLKEDTTPFTGYAISFPGSEHNAYVSYAVNEQLLEKFFTEEDAEEFDDVED
jgi:hypothetical protein